MNNDFHEYSAAFHDHQNDLAHYGIKGMRKGVRKKRDNDTNDYLKRKAENFMTRTENNARNTGDHLTKRANQGDWMTLAWHYKRNPTANALINNEIKSTAKNTLTGNQNQLYNAIYDKTGIKPKKKRRK